MRRPVVLVLRADDTFSARLREGGFEVINCELIKTEAVDDLGELQNKLADIGKFDGICFTSPAAATVFLREFHIAGHSFPRRIYVLGERTKRVFENSGINVEYNHDVNNAEELIASFDGTEFAGKRLLFVRGDKSMRTIPELLKGRAEVDEVVVYRTMENDLEAGAVNEIRRRLRSGEVGWICFFSPSAVDSFRKFFDLEDLEGVKTAAIGQTTAQRGKESGLNADFISPRAGAQDFAAGLIEYIKSID